MEIAAMVTFTEPFAEMPLSAEMNEIKVDYVACSNDANSIVDADVGCFDLLHHSKSAAYLQYLLRYPP